MSEPTPTWTNSLPNTLPLVLPWPDKRLSPNSRGAWYVKEAPRKAARELGAAVVWEAGPVALPDRLKMWVTFHPPRRGRFDLDNALSKLKPILDGIFAALGRDDADVQTITLDRRSPVKGGSVIVTIGDAGL